MEEFHVITWESKKEQIFEMPTGGAAVMRAGPNLLKLSRKEQCLALLTQLRTKFKLDGFIYRVFPNGEVQFLHPKDGVYPEKVNAGRQAVNANDRSIGKNVNPAQIKFAGEHLNILEYAWWLAKCFTMLSHGVSERENVGLNIRCRLRAGKLGTFDV